MGGLVGSGFRAGAFENPNGFVSVTWYGFKQSKNSGFWLWLLLWGFF